MVEEKPLVNVAMDLEVIPLIEKRALNSALSDEITHEAAKCISEVCAEKGVRYSPVLGKTHSLRIFIVEGPREAIEGAPIDGWVLVIGLKKDDAADTLAMRQIFLFLNELKQIVSYERMVDE
jgi:hypothetical protein